jgi:hypothetical protein
MHHPVGGDRLRLDPHTPTHLHPGPHPVGCWVPLLLTGMFWLTVAVVLWRWLGD